MASLNMGRGEEEGAHVKKRKLYRRHRHYCSPPANHNAALLAEEEAVAEAQTKVESSQPTNLLVILSQQVMREGNFGKEQKADDWFKHCWGHVLQIDGENKQPN